MEIELNQRSLCELLEEIGENLFGTPISEYPQVLFLATGTPHSSSVLITNLTVLGSTALVIYILLGAWQRGLLAGWGAGASTCSAQDGSGYRRHTAGHYARVHKTVVVCPQTASGAK